MLNRFLVKGLSLCVIFAVTSSASNSDKVAIPRTRFEILSPEALVKPNGYNHTIALFASYPRDVSISSPLFPTTNNFCSPVSDLNRAGLIRGLPDGYQPNEYFVMGVRGNCRFEQKARNAQLMGAAGLVIANDVCVCGDTDCSPTGSGNCEDSFPIMAGSSTFSSNQVSIPVFMIKKQDAGDITQYVRNNNDWLLSRMTFSVPDFETKLQYEIVTNIANPASEEFLASFGSIATSLAPYTQFKPAYQFWTANCAGSCGPEACTNMGRYCGTYSTVDKVGEPKGKDIVREILRRGCIWKEYGQDGFGHEWWEYIKSQHGSCAGTFQDETCIQLAMVTAGVDASKIESCMRYSGGLESNNDNSILENLLPGVYPFAPKVSIGGSGELGNQPMHESFTTENVRQSICNGFMEAYEPTACLTSHLDKPPESKNTEAAPKSSDVMKSSPRNGAFWFGLLCVLVLSNYVSYVIAKTVSRREANQAILCIRQTETDPGRDDNHDDHEIEMLPARETRSFV